MKIFGYMDDFIAWQLGLEWYWQYAWAIGVIVILYFIIWIMLKFRYSSWGSS